MFDHGTTDRGLTAAERLMLQRVFNGQVDFSLITIRNYDPDDPNNDRSFHSENVIHLLDGDYADDISLGTMEQKAVLVHEVAHAWQYQKTGYCSSQEELDAHFQQKAYDAWYEHAVVIQRQIEAQLLEWSDYLKTELPRTPVAEHADFKAAVRDYQSRVLSKLYKKQDSLIGVQARALRNVASDKSGYLDRESYDPVLSAMGPLDEFESAPSHIGRPAYLDAPPAPGERLSDFLWRNPAVKRGFGTKSDLRLYLECHAHEEDGSGTSHIDYNYMLKRPGTVGFYDLRVEAQAQVITEYFLIKNGVDPRVIFQTNMNTRPPLRFYEKIIPFLATPAEAR